MDCEKFDLHLMDALYDELDEVTTAAMKRHMEGCSRCAGAMSRLRAVRDVAMVPLEQPSDELEGRILAAAARAQRGTSWPRKALRGLAWAGSHAMRPQLAMAALFVLIIGSSLLLLRPKPASMPTPVRVTERGVPALEPDESPSPAAAAPQATASPQTAALPADRGDPLEAKKGNAAEAQAAAEPPANDAKAALADARAVRSKSGCAAAVKAYNEVGARFPATVSAADAMWEAAECYKSMGDIAKAQELYIALKSYSSYRDRADQELADAVASSNNAGKQMASRGAAAAPGGYMPKAAAPAPAAAPPASAPAQAMSESTAAPAAKATGGVPSNTKPAAPMKSQKAMDAAGY